MSGSAAKFLNPSGNASYGIVVCDRCQTKRFLHELRSDPNVPGLKVCRSDAEGCWDKLDPYRLPARQPDKYSLPFYRPDQPMEMPTTPYAPTPQAQALTLDDVVRDG